MSSYIEPFLAAVSDDNTYEAIDEDIAGTRLRLSKDGREILGAFKEDDPVLHRMFASELPSGSEITRKADEAGKSRTAVIMDFLSEVYDTTASTSKKREILYLLTIYVMHRRGRKLRSKLRRYRRLPRVFSK
jgi:hypothetical protein